jgi:hypothetical protein
LLASADNDGVVEGDDDDDDDDDGEHAPFGDAVTSSAARDVRSSCLCVRTVLAQLLLDPDRAATPWQQLL